MMCEEGVIPTADYLNALNILGVPIPSPSDMQISEALYAHEYDLVMAAGLSP